MSRVRRRLVITWPGRHTCNKREELRVVDPGLLEIGITPPFIRSEENNRGHERLPKRRHFKFFYNSIYSRREDYVLLDILEEHNHFPETNLLPVRNRIDDARVSAAKTACLAAMLKQDVITRNLPDIRFGPNRLAELRDTTIESRPVRVQL